MDDLRKPAQTAPVSGPETEDDPKSAYIKEMKSSQKTAGRYFQDALSDFMYDAASGRAVRHLADDGYTSVQIMQRLDYPTPLAKIKKTVTRHFFETGVLCAELPVSTACLKPVKLPALSEEKLFSLLSQRIRLNGEKNSYISCPFGSIGTENSSVPQILSPLTKREQEYILGILWESETTYHQLNRRMLEIGTQLALRPNAVSFYFLKSREVLST